MLLVSLLWLLTVAGASALTWSVISAAGARVGQPIQVAAPVQSAAATPGGGGSSGSWSGDGGRLTARCLGDAISLVTAVPDVGYSVDIGKRGPDELRVVFESRAVGAETKVSATCDGGEPLFRD